MNSLFKLGHPLIDQQHAELHRSLQCLRAMLDAGAPASDVGDEFSSLSRKICAHFADEEAAMRSLSVPPAVAEAHGKEHDRILGELVSLHEAEMMGNRPNLANLCTMAETWILHHLEEFDRPLAGYFIREQT